MSHTGTTDADEAAARARISDDEVDALLEKVGSGAAVATGTRNGAVRPYDLVAPDKIVRSRLPAFDRLNERWVGEFQRKAVELVRRPLEVNVREVQLSAYGEWQAGIPALSSLNIFVVKPWRRHALVAIDGQLLFALVDAYYGGAGRVAESPRRDDLTPTERRLNAMVVGLLLGHFKQAFERIAVLEFEHEKTEVNPSYVQIATPSETVAITRVELSVSGVTGTIAIVLPMSMLESVREKLTEDVQDVGAEVKQRWYTTMRARLEQTELELRSVFLSTELTLRELLQLKPGDILPIEMPKTATLFAGAQPLLTGKFGLSRGYNAIRIVESVREACGRDKEKCSP